MRTILYAILGFTIASVLAWGGLLTWGFLFLDPNDSYWDRTPYAADTFFACWLLLSIVAAIAAARWSRRHP